MKLVLQIHLPGVDGHSLHHITDQFPLYIGRGFHNHVILADPHVSAEHVRVDFDDGAWRVSDLGSDNGLLVNDRAEHGKISAIKSGDKIRIGQTEIYFYAPLHPVPSAVQIQRRHPAISWLASSKCMWLSLVALLLFSLGSVYDQVFAEDGLLKPLVGAAIFSSAAALLWAVLWAVGGRLSKKKAYFKAHLSLAALYLSANVLLMKAMDVLYFITSESPVIAIIDYAFFFALTAGLLGASLFFATTMPARKCKFAGIFFAFGLLLSIYGMEQIIQDDFIVEPSPSVILEPYFQSFAPVSSTEAFLAEAHDLFQSPLFDEE